MRKHAARAQEISGSRTGWLASAWLTILGGAGLGLGVSAVHVEAQRATMQVTVEVVEGNKVSTAPVVERAQVSSGHSDSEGAVGRLIVGSAAPWQLLISTEKVVAGGERSLDRKSAGEGKLRAAGEPGSAASVPMRAAGEALLVTYVLVTN